MASPYESPAARPVDVLLRDVRIDDLPTLYAFQCDPESCAMAMVRPRSEADFLAVWEKVFRSRADVAPHVRQRAIVADGKLCGAIGIFLLDGQPAVGYQVGREHWGRGLASRAVALLLAECALRPLRARAAASNAASVRVLTKNGFAITGRQFSPGTERYIECEEVCFVLG